MNPIGTRGVYDEAKRFSEALVTAYRTNRGVDTAIVRIFNSYGPRMRAGDGRAIPSFIAQAMTGQPVTVAGDGSQTRSVCFVDDTVRGILDLAESGHPGPMNIGSPDEISMLDLARCVIKRTGSASSIQFVPLPVDDPRVRRPDTSLARAVLGWEARVPLDVGLDRTIAWHRAALTAA